MTPTPHGKPMTVLAVVLIIYLCSAGTLGTPGSVPPAAPDDDPPQDKTVQGSQPPKKIEEKQDVQQKIEAKRDVVPGTIESMGNQLLGIQLPDGTRRIIEKPSKGKAANEIINPKRYNNNKKSTSPSTIRPVGATQAGDKGNKEEDYKESYLPLYMCDDLSADMVELEPLYRGCVHGCQMKDPVTVTPVAPVSPQPYESKLEVTWLSATQMYDTCHEDILGGEHRSKSAIEYPLSEKEVHDILKEVEDHLVLNQDMIHGKYPHADCSYWEDTKESSIMTRIRKSHYDLYFAPELDDYYIHIPNEQINVLYWDGGYTGRTGSYAWDYRHMTIPCLAKEAEYVSCIGSLDKGDKLQCVSAGIMFEGPYTTYYDDGCKRWSHKDNRGNVFRSKDERVMAYGDAVKDSNPNIQSLSSALTHLEELICLSGCSELTWMSVVNNTNLIVDTPVGIWKRTSEYGNKAMQCSVLSTGKISLLTPICTLMGHVGVQHIGSSSTTYYWDMNQLYATTNRPGCLDETITDMTKMMQHQMNNTLTLDTFMGRVELNTKTGESRFLYYNENIQIDKKRWFPNVALEQTPADEKTGELEIAIMQQMRNLSAEYQASCQEAKGPVIFQTVGGAVWMLEQDVGSVWDGITHWFWLWKVGAILITSWLAIYIVILCLGIFRAIFTAKQLIRVPVEYARRKSG